MAVPHYIDMQMETLRDDFIATEPMLKYLRYNFPITENDLNGLELNRVFTEEDIADMVEMGNAQNRYLLYDIGVKAASEVKPEHVA